MSYGFLFLSERSASSAAILRACGTSARCGWVKALAHCLLIHDVHTLIMTGDVELTDEHDGSANCVECVHLCSLVIYA